MPDATRSTPESTGSWAEILTGHLGLYTFVLSLGMTLFAINQFVVATIMPTVVGDLGGVGYYTWAFSLFAVGAIVGSASAGPLREAFGARRSFAASGLVLGVGLAGAALANDMLSLVAFRLIQGIGGGTLASQAYGLVAVAYPPHLRSRVLGVISTVWGIATVAGPGFGGIFAEFGIWRGAFWSLVPFSVAFAWLAWRVVEGGGGHGRLSEIPFGRLALLGAAVVLMSMASLGDEAWLQAMLIVGGIAIAGFAFARDAKAHRNMFPRDATAAVTELGAACWILFLVSIVLTFVNTYTTFYLQVLHGVTPFAAGYIFAIQSLMWTAGALIVATWRNIFEIVAIGIGLALLLLASLAIALRVDTGPVAAIAVAIGTGGAGIGFMNNPAIQRIIALAPEAEKHVAGTSVQTIRNIGISFGAAISGVVAATAGLADGSDQETVASAMRWVYGVNVAFAVAALAMLLPLIVGRRAQRRRPLA